MGALYKGSCEGCGAGSGTSGPVVLWALSPGVGRGCAFSCLVLQQKFPASFSQSSVVRFLCFLRSLRNLWW